MELVRTVRAARFLFTGPILFMVLLTVHHFATPGADWLRWAALGLGIAWLLCLIRVIKAVILVGGLAALIALLRKR